ncbi:hypothetical protein RN001_000215 [Aquatica leii]|uniref:Uncharacterized protein n=1 Tax=Aquatica leii TaxID=1421715 RepID=A0AAN7PEM0_9COLE|nr:hypothetical protein RN001_000215 [Aquatica leii]
MSFETKLNDKTFLASGDGTKNILKDRIKKSEKIPSSRCFGTRSLSNNSNKVKLQNAIQELSTPVLRKKALTLAEITPTRNKNHSAPNDCCLTIVTKCDNRKDAARRIYELLLLNSWRKRKADISLLTDSLRALETQNRKLERQIDALHRLRLAESEKRNEAVAQTQLLHRENEETIHRNTVLEKEKKLLQKEVEMFREKLTVTQTQFENTKNELIAKHIDLENVDYQLSLEKRKIKRLRTEKKSLEEQEEIRKQEIQDYREQLAELHNNLLNAEINLEDSIASNDNYKRENGNLTEKLEVEVSTNRRIQENNEKLKFCLFAIKRVLRKEQNRPWWKNASDLGFAFLSSLKTVSGILLPLAPHA